MRIICEVCLRLTNDGYNSRVLIADSSTDNTAFLARLFGCEVCEVKERGYGAAYKKALSIIDDGLVFTLDADQTYSAWEIFNFLNNYEEGAFISGNRLIRENKASFTLLNWFGNKLFNFITLALLNVKLKDSQSGQWLFNIDDYRKLSCKEDGMPFSTEIKLEASKKLKFKEIEISYAKRLDKAKLRPLYDGWQIIKFLVRRKIYG